MILSDVLAASIAWRPVDGDLVLLAGTVDDLPVIETALATLPAKARGQVFVEVENPDEMRELRAVLGHEQHAVDCKRDVVLEQLGGRFLTRPGQDFVLPAGATGR